MYDLLRPWLRGPEDEPNTNGGDPGGGTPSTTQDKPKPSNPAELMRQKAAERKIFEDKPDGKEDGKLDGKEDGKPEDKPEGKEDGKPEDKPEGKEDDKPEDTGLSDEDRALIDEEVKKVETEHRQLTLLGAWAEGITEETRNWMNSLRRKRDEEASIKGEDPTKTTPTAGGPTGKPEDTPAAKTVAISIPKAFQAIKSVEENGLYSPTLMDQEWLRKYGIDPKAVDEKYATAIAALIKSHNEVARTAEIISKEAKQAYDKRDEVKGRLFKTEFRHEVERLGFEWDASFDALVPEAKKVAYKNGERQPWKGVIKKLQEKHPKIMADSKRKDQPGTPDGKPGETPSATPKPPQGTRTTTGDAHVKPPSGSSGPKPKTIAEASQLFAKKLKEKSGKLFNK